MIYSHIQCLLIAIKVVANGETLVEKVAEKKKGKKRKEKDRNNEGREQQNYIARIELNGSACREQPQRVEG